MLAFQILHNDYNNKNKNSFQLPVDVNINELIKYLKLWSSEPTIAGYCNQIIIALQNNNSKNNNYHKKSNNNYNRNDGLLNSKCSNDVSNAFRNENIGIKHIVGGVIPANSYVHEQKQIIEDEMMKNGNYDIKWNLGQPSYADNKFKQNANMMDNYSNQIVNEPNELP